MAERPVRGWKRALPIAVALAAVAVAETASAQNLLDMLYDMLRGRAPHMRGMPRLPLDPFHGLREGDVQSPPDGPYATYCVRLCDGSYFPIQQGERGEAGAENLCRAMCPAAETRVFSGSGIEQAIARNGSRYTDLSNAFRYREQRVSGCSCGGKPSGLASIDPMSDPTLRPGDIVVTRDGPMVFTGRRRSPQQADEFVPAENYRGLPRSVRRTLSEMRVAPEPKMLRPETPAEERPREPAGTFAPQASLSP